MVSKFFTLAAFALLTAVMPADAMIIDISSTITVMQGTPSDGNSGADNIPAAFAFDEQQDVLLGQMLSTDTGTIAAGTRIDSHYIAFFNSNAFGQISTITFDGAVLGIIYLTPDLFAASGFLGLANLTYFDSCNFCGYEAADSANFTGNRAFLQSHFRRPGDFARIITAAPTEIPEPGSLALMAAGLAAFGLFWRRHTGRHAVAA